MAASGSSASTNSSLIEWQHLRFVVTDAPNKFNVGQVCLRICVKYLLDINAIKFFLSICTHITIDNCGFAESWSEVLCSIL